MVITEKSYADALDRVVEIVGKRKPSLDVNNIVIVPDIYTFALEQRLFTSGKGAFDLEVTTFNRLYMRFALGKNKALSKQGALMLLKKVCREHADKLSCYTHSCMRTGFAVKLYDALNTLRSCAVSPEDLEGACVMKKAGDLAVLYREYLKEIDGKYVDAAGRNRLLGQAIERTGMLKNANVYVTLYDRYSAEVKKLLETIERNALSLTVVEAASPIGYTVPSRPVIMKCPDHAAEYKEVAKCIASYVYGGGKYDDIAVVDGSGEYHTAKRIFDEFNIPYYTGEKLPLAGTELVRFIFSALECVRRKYRMPDMLALSANIYAGLDRRDVDSFRCYVGRYCVDYLGFMSPFTRHDDDEEGLAESAEKVRARLMSLLGVLDGCFDSAARLTESLNALLDKCDAEKITNEITGADEDGKDYGGVYEKTKELIDLFGELGGGGAVTAEESEDVLREIFEGTSVSLVPNRSNVVQIGPLSQYRGRRVEYAIIVGFNEGEIPVVNGDNGLLTDADANQLKGYTLKVEPCTAEKNALCRGELWHFLKAAKRLFITYTEGGGAKPSFDLKLLQKNNSIIDKYCGSGEYKEKLEKATDPMTVAELTGSRSIALETLLKYPKLEYSGSLKEATGSLKDALERRERSVRLRKDNIPFLRGKTTSVSALQTYFECPYKYYFRYGLKIKKADDGLVTPLDVGQFLHKIVELYVTAGMPSNVAEFVEKTAEAEREKFAKYRLKENERTYKKLKEEAVTLCGVVANQVSAGDFRPYKTEASFGRENSDLTTVTLPASGVKLVGDIDRIDLYGDRARVIDYKTGSIDFSWKDLYYGKKIQLMIYTRVMRENGYRSAGFFYFPFSVRWSDDEFDHRLKGAFDSSPDMLTALDGSLTAENVANVKSDISADGDKAKKSLKSTIIEVSLGLNKTGGTYILGNNTHACKEEELDAAADYAVAVADKAATEITDGNIVASPYADGKKSACDYCDYATICGRQAVCRRVGSIDKNTIVGAVAQSDDKAVTE